VKNDTEDIDKTAKPGSTSHFKALTINYELYEKYLEDSDLTETQKRQFLDALWSIIVSFADLGFGVHPLQQVSSDTCEQMEIPAQFLNPNSDDMVECTGKSKSQFNNATDRQSGLLDEGSRK